MQLRPFRALRPAPDLAARVVSPPYDVVSRSEAAALAAGEPMSFLHVVRSEIDLPDDTDAHDPRVYERARRNLERLAARRRARARSRSRALRLSRGDGRARPDRGRRLRLRRRVRARRDQKHESTRPDKEDDRTRHILALEAHAEPVFFAYRGSAEVDRLVAAAMRRPPSTT